MSVYMACDYAGCTEFAPEGSSHLFRWFRVERMDPDDFADFHFCSPDHAALHLMGFRVPEGIGKEGAA